MFGSLRNTSGLDVQYCKEHPSTLPHLQHALIPVLREARGQMHVILRDLVKHSILTLPCVAGTSDFMV